MTTNEMARALQQAADWFQDYADGHAAKGDTDKAKRNQDRADACRAALTPPPVADAEVEDVCRRLTLLSAEMLRLDMDMKLSPGAIDPADGATAIRRLHARAVQAEAALAAGIKIRRVEYQPFTIEDAAETTGCVTSAEIVRQFRERLDTMREQAKTWLNTAPTTADVASANYRAKQMERERDAARDLLREAGEALEHIFNDAADMVDPGTVGGRPWNQVDIRVCERIADAARAVLAKITAGQTLVSQVSDAVSEADRSVENCNAGETGHGR